MTTFGNSTPILRIFDVAKAREFYLDFLGFNVDFEHRYGENFPLYLGISLASCRLHLSEHYGDASPGAHLRIECSDVESLVRALADRQYRYAKPGAPTKTAWDTTEFTVHDPFGNRLTFVQEH